MSTSFRKIQEFLNHFYPVKESDPSLFKGSSAGSGGGVISDSGTFYFNANPRISTKLSKEIKFNFNFQYDHYRPSETFYRPDLRTVRIARAVEPRHMGYIKNLNTGFRIDLGAKKFPDGLRTLHRRQEILWKALHMPSPADMVSENHWTLDKLKEKWPKILKAITLTTWIAAGNTPEHAKRNLTKSAKYIENEFIKLNPNLLLIKEAQLLHEAMAEIKFVSQFLKAMQKRPILREYRVAFARFRMLYLLYLKGKVNEGDGLLWLAKEGRWDEFDKAIAPKWEEIKRDYTADYNGTLTEERGATKARLQAEREFLLRRNGYPHSYESSTNGIGEINDARNIDTRIGLINAMAQPGDPDFRHYNVIMGDMIPHGAAGYGLGLLVNGNYAFGSYRKILETGLRLAIQAPGLIWLYGHDGEYFDPQMWVINTDAKISLWPLRRIGIDLQGGISKGYKDLAGLSSYWGLVQLKLLAMDGKHSSLAFVPSFTMGRENDYPTWAAVIDIFYDIRKGHKADDLSLIPYFTMHHRKVGEIVDKPIQVEVDGKIATRDLGGTDMHGAPVVVSVSKEESATTFGIEAIWKKIGGSPLALNLNTGIYNASRGANIGPLDGEWSAFALLSLMGYIP